MFVINKFRNCSSLTNITLPNGLVHIKSGAFRGCTKLTNLILPKSLLIIGSFVFESIPLLNNVVKIYTEEELTDEQIEDGWEDTIIEDESFDYRNKW